MLKNSAILITGGTGSLGHTFESFARLTHISDFNIVDKTFQTLDLNEFFSPRIRTIISKISSRVKLC